MAEPTQENRIRFIGYVIIVLLLVIIAQLAVMMGILGPCSMSGYGTKKYCPIDMMKMKAPAMEQKGSTMTQP